MRLVCLLFATAQLSNAFSSASARISYSRCSCRLFHDLSHILFLRRLTSRSHVSASVRDSGLVVVVLLECVGRICATNTSRPFSFHPIFATFQVFFAGPIKSVPRNSWDKSRGVVSRSCLFFPFSSFLGQMEGAPIERREFWFIVFSAKRRTTL